MDTNSAKVPDRQPNGIDRGAFEHQIWVFYLRKTN